MAAKAVISKLQRVKYFNCPLVLTGRSTSAMGKIPYMKNYITFLTRKTIRSVLKSFGTFKCIEESQQNGGKKLSLNYQFSLSHLKNKLVCNVILCFRLYKIQSIESGWKITFNQNFSFY